MGPQPGAAQRGEQGRHDRSTADAFVALMQRHTPPLPRSRRFIEQNLHAVRADSSRVNNAAVVHAPQEGIMLEDCPLHACKSCLGCSIKGPLTAAHGRAFSRCSSCAFLTHFSMVVSGIHQSHTACVRAITGAGSRRPGRARFPPSSAPWLRSCRTRALPNTTPSASGTAAAAFH